MKRVEKPSSDPPAARFFRRPPGFHADQQRCDECGAGNPGGDVFAICLNCGKTFCRNDEGRHQCAPRMPNA